MSRLGFYDDSVLIVMSDNGGCSCVDARARARVSLLGGRALTRRPLRPPPSRQVFGRIELAAARRETVPVRGRDPRQRLCPLAVDQPRGPRDGVSAHLPRFRLAADAAARRAPSGARSDPGRSRRRRSLASHDARDRLVADPAPHRAAPQHRQVVARGRVHERVHPADGGAGHSRRRHEAADGSGQCVCVSVFGEEGGDVYERGALRLRRQRGANAAASL